MPVNHGTKCKISCTVMENLIKSLISLGIRFWKEIFTKCTESGGYTIVVAILAMLKSYVPEKGSAALARKVMLSIARI